MVLDLHSWSTFEAAEKMRDSVESGEGTNGISPGFPGLWPGVVIRWVKPYNQYWISLFT